MLLLNHDVNRVGSELRPRVMGFPELRGPTGYQGLSFDLELPGISASN